MRQRCRILSSLCAVLLVLAPSFIVYGAQPVGPGGTQSVLQVKAGLVDIGFSHAHQSIRIGFIDTGISAKHLNGAQVAVGKNYVFPERDTQDRDGHGTATAGMVLGSEELGIKGSCPEAVAVPLVTIDKYATGIVNKGDVSVMCQAIYDAVDVYGCRVVNMSMGVTEDAEELRRAVEYAESRGVVVVSAVGNDNALYPDRTYYPAGYPTVIGVGAAESLLAESFDSADRAVGGWKVAEFSQRSGVSVLADGYRLATVTNRNAAEAALRSGTSYACAAVAGLCAQLLTDAPSLRPAEVRAILFAEAKELGAAGLDAASGWGVVGLGVPSTENVTRGMLVAFLYESARRPLDNATGSIANLYGLAGGPWISVAGSFANSGVGFEDVPADSYYAQAVAWTVEEGIVRGYSATHFGPLDAVSREQMAVIMENYTRAQGFDGSCRGDIGSFIDEKAVSDWARGSVAWAVENGLIQGKGGGVLDPAGTITREEAGLILRRLWDEKLQ